MDPNQQDSSSVGSTDVPAPEVTPTPEAAPEVAPEATPVTPEAPATPSEPVLDAPAPTLEPSAPVESSPDPTLSTASADNPVDIVQPTEPSAPEQPPVDLTAPAASTVPVGSTAPIDPVAPVATPPAPTSPTQPAAGQPIASSVNPPTNEQPKSKKGLIIGLVSGIGGLVVIGVALVLIFFVFNGGGQIKNFAEFKDAIENRKALNCSAEISQNGVSLEMTIQADDGWNKLHMSIPSMMNTEMWTVKEGDKYTAYTTSMGQYMKSTQSSLDTSGINSSSLSEDDVKNLDCKPNNQADFTVPDEDWKESPLESFDF
jgi:hypothetical protein